MSATELLAASDLRGELKWRLRDRGILDNDGDSTLGAVCAVRLQNEASDYVTLDFAREQQRK